MNRNQLHRRDAGHSVHGRRTAAAREDGVGWTYGYNDRGEVSSGTRGAQSFSYSYDEIGNRTFATTMGVEQDGQQTIAYEANPLNQYTAITNPDPGRRTVRGMLRAAAALTVSSSAPPPPSVTETPAGASKVFAATAEAETTNGPAWRTVTIEGKAGGGRNGGGHHHEARGGFLLSAEERGPRLR